MTDIMPPSNEEAEQAVLGSLIIDPFTIAKVACILKPDNFYYTKNQWIYESILKLGLNTDPLSLSSDLKSREIFDEVGADAYLAELAACVPSALNVEHYAHVVNDNATRRNLLQSCSEIAKLCWAGAEDIDTVISKSQHFFTKACHTSANMSTITKQEACEQYMEGFDAMIESGVMPGIPSGLPELDKLFGGWKRGKLYTFGGLPGAGKTTLMLNILLNAAAAGYHSAMYSCEMTEEELVSVCISYLVGKRDPMINLSSGTLFLYPPEKRQQIRQMVALARADLEQLPIKLYCIPGMSTTQLSFELKREKATNGLDIAAADYIQIMTPPAAARNQGREREISSISEDLKHIAMDHDLLIPILTGTQLNDEGQVRESRAIEQNSDGVILLTSDGGVVVDVNVKKNRGGPIGQLQLRFLRHRATILSMGGAELPWQAAA